MTLAAIVNDSRDDRFVVVGWLTFEGEVIVDLLEERLGEVFVVLEASPLPLLALTLLWPLFKVPSSWQRSRMLCGIR